MEPKEYKDYEDQITKAFDDLLAKAEGGNLLYYLMNLFGRGALGHAVRFHATVNELTNALVLRKTRARRSVSAPDMLFAIQLNIESKAFYATLRNFIYTIVGKRFRPDPWERSEYSGKRGQPAVLRTGRIQQAIARDLEGAGFPELAAEFRRSHIEDLGPIRNAVAHAAFVLPDEENERMWTFGDYYIRERAYIELRLRQYSATEFNTICKRFLGYRLAFYRAFDRHHARYADKTFDFVARNQMAPHEELSCRFERGNIEIKYRGNPLW